MHKRILRVGSASYAVPDATTLDELRERIVDAARAGGALVDLPQADGHEKSVLITPHLHIVIEEYVSEEHDTNFDPSDLDRFTAEMNAALRTFDF